MLISQHLKPEAVLLDTKGQTTAEVLGELASNIASQHKELDAGKLEEALIQREALLSTASGNEIAFPHCYCKIKNPRFAIAISKQGVDAEAPDDKPVHIFLLVISPEKDPNIHLEALSAASKLFLCKDVREQVKSAGSPDELISYIIEAEKKANE